MRTRDRPKREDQRHQRGAGGHGIREQRDRNVAGRQPFAHDPGTDDRGEQQRGADRFGHDPTRERRAPAHAEHRPGAAARAASHVSSPSAIWLRAELCVQRNETRSSLIDARA